MTQLPPNLDKEFESFSHSDECETLRFADFENNPWADCYCQLKELKAFSLKCYQLGLEDQGRKANSGRQLFQDGYRQAVEDVIKEAILEREKLRPMDYFSDEFFKGYSAAVDDLSKPLT